MSATLAGHAETLRYRQALEANAALVARGIVSAWSVVDPADIDATLLAALPGTVAAVRLGQARAVNASADYVARFVAAETAGDPYAIGAGLVRAGVDDLPGSTVSGKPLAYVVMWARVMAKQMIGQGVPPKQALRIALASNESVGRSEAFRAAQTTVRAITTANPDQVAGWRRTPSRRACAFCLSLVTGVVGHEETTAAFHAHRNCGCTAEPAVRGVDSGTYLLSA